MYHILFCCSDVDGFGAGVWSILCFLRENIMRTQAKDLQQRERKIKAARGKILDRNGVVLADNKSVISVIPIIKEPEAVIAMLVKELEFRKKKFISG